jgi:TorA maturation chaperone TorD
MDKQTRVYMYAFLSTIFSDAPSLELIEDIKKNEQLLNMIGKDTLEYFKSSDAKKIEEDLEVDYSSIFLMHNPPMESAVLDGKDEILVGLQNPVMQFYFQNGYELNMSNTQIQTPDHISIELSFMQNLIMKDNDGKQEEFLYKHLLNWIPQYLISCKDMATCIFYKELFDFCVEFLVADYDNLVEQNKKMA